MTIDEAIKRLQNELNHGFRCGYEDLDKAQRLGIEALKRLQEQRSRTIIDEDDLLPGETEE